MRLSLFPRLTLLFVGLLTVAHFGFTHEGIYDFDDYTYARYAHQLLTGTYLPAPPPLHPDHIPLHARWAVFGPVAALYGLLGVGIISTTLWPLLCTLGASGLVFLAYRRRAPVAASAAMLLLGLHYFTLNLSTYLYPDNVLLFFATACAVALLSGRRAGQRHPAAWGALFAACNLAALLSKETIAYYLPFYLVLLLRDAWHRRHLWFWGAALGAGAGLLAGYLGYYQLVAHEALYPFRVVEHANETLKHHSYALGRSDVLARITWQPLALLVGTGLGAVALLAGWAGAQARQLMHREARFWLALGGSALAFYWVGSTSLTYYNPNSLLPRMLAPLLPPLCVAAGFGLEHYWRTGRGGAWLTLGLLACAAWLRNSLSGVYGVLGLGVGASAWLAGRPAGPAWARPGTPGRAALLLLTLALGLSLRPVYFMTKPSRSAFFAQQRLLLRELPAAARGVVLVDEFLARNYDFSYGFAAPKELAFRVYPPAPDSVPGAAAGRPTWLLLNRATLRNEDLQGILPYSAEEVLARFPRRRLVAQEGPVELYRVAP